MSSETHSCVKSPAFDGEDKNWPIFKRKMETCLARLDLTEVLDDSIVFPKDDEMGTTDAEKERLHPIIHFAPVLETAKKTKTTNF